MPHAMTLYSINRYCLTPLHVVAMIKRATAVDNNSNSNSSSNNSRNTIPFRTSTNINNRVVMDLINRVGRTGSTAGSANGLTTVNNDNNSNNTLATTTYCITPSFAPRYSNKLSHQ